MKIGGIALTCCAFVAGCNQPSSPLETSGYVEVLQPDGHFQKVHLRCARLYNPGTGEFSLTGVTVPMTAIIKPQVGGVSTKITADSVSEKIIGLDLQQMQICLALLLRSPEHRDQIFRDYIGIGGQLTQAVRSLSDATTSSQYAASASKVETGKVAAVTANAANNAKQKDPTLATINIPPLKIDEPGEATYQPSQGTPRSDSPPNRTGSEPHQ